ncbi:hypothetical protein ACFPN1_04740 [Lysobacter yangpyeongensis]|jgi:hypothetical protein|uniref:Uncharacterized protein n=1 Tax=Lysobacter yangpyeongensis TaxID=346182 RepID=A0ABW0SKD5_9GAMM
MTQDPAPSGMRENEVPSSLHELYAPPSSRPAVGGVVRTAGRPLWVGYGLGWAAIGFTFLWVVVAFPVFIRFTSIGIGAVAAAVWLGLLVAPTLALIAYLGWRRQWKALLGTALAWASALVLGALLLLLVAGLGRTF